MRRAAIDVGTNSVLLLVADVEDERIATVVEEGEEIVRLGEGISRHRKLCEEAIIRTIAAVRAFSERASALGAKSLWTTTTSAVRDATNRVLFIDQMQREIGVDIEVLSGEEEAERTFLGVASNEAYCSKKLLVMDVGGGSTEVVLGSDGSIELRASLKIGCVRLTEELAHGDPLDERSFERMLGRTRRLLTGYLEAKDLGERVLVGTGGTATTLGAMERGRGAYSRLDVDGHVVTKAWVEALLEQLWCMPLAERKRVPGLPPKRADVIVAGMVIFWTAMDLWGFERMTISSRDLRYGTILRKVWENGE